MANRYPLVFDTAAKKIKELPIGDDLQVSGNLQLLNNGNILLGETGNILFNNESIENYIQTRITINYNQINDTPFIPIDITDLTDVGNLLDKSELVGTNIYSNDSTLLVDGINGSIPYSVISDIPFIPSDISDLTDETGLIPSDVSELTDNSGVIPTDVSELTDLTNKIPTDLNQLTDIDGLLGDGSTTGGVATFIELLDTPASYTSNANKFLKVDPTSSGIVFNNLTSTEVVSALGYTPYNGTLNPAGFIDVIEFQDVTDALGYTPYNGLENPSAFISTSQEIIDTLGYTPYDGQLNPSGFLTEESDTLDSVISRGNSTTQTVTFNNINASSLTAPSITLRNSIQFGNSNSNDFTINIENTRKLTISGGDLVVDSTATFGSNLLGSVDTQPSLGTELNPWSNSYATSTQTDSIKSLTNTEMIVETSNGLNVALTTNKKFKITGFGTFTLPLVLSNTERAQLTPTVGDMIYNQTESTIQVYVGIVSWAGNPAQPVPGWINLYTPPPAPIPT